MFLIISEIYLFLFRTHVNITLKTLYDIVEKGLGGKLKIEVQIKYVKQMKKACLLLARLLHYKQ